jgi:hypothetical protein
MTAQLALALPAEPPLLALLRELCAGTGRPTSHPCPDGVTVHYIAFASAGDVRAIHAELMGHWQAGRVARTVTDDDTYGALWRPL